MALSGAAERRIDSASAADLDPEGAFARLARGATFLTSLSTGEAAWATQAATPNSATPPLEVSQAIDNPDNGVKPESNSCWRASDS